MRAPPSRGPGIVNRKRRGDGKRFYVPRHCRLSPPRTPGVSLPPDGRPTSCHLDPEVSLASPTRSVRVLVMVLTVSAFAGGAAPPRADRVVPNDNRVAAGVLRNGVLTLRLEVRVASWFPDESDGPSLELPMFAEVGHATRNPGPLIRVPAGTRIQVSVHNTLSDSTLVVYGLHTRPSTLGDTIQIAPGVTRRVSFLAGAPGSYFYWARRRIRPFRIAVGSTASFRGRSSSTHPVALHHRTASSYSGPGSVRRTIRDSSRPSCASSTVCRGRTQSGSHTQSATPCACVG